MAMGEGGVQNTHYFLIAERGTTSNEHDASLATVSHVREDSIRDVHGAKEVCVHHIHDALSPVHSFVVNPYEQQQQQQRKRAAKLNMNK